MKPEQGLSEITCRIIESLKSIIEAFKPNVVVLHSDITTTLATSLGRSISASWLRM
jgi:UDP-N-acetylglucosamine 2-epimerase (non-hydrolysing)